MQVSLCKGWQGFSPWCGLVPIILLPQGIKDLPLPCEHACITHTLTHTHTCTHIHTQRIRWHSSLWNVVCDQTFRLCQVSKMQACVFFIGNSLYYHLAVAETRTKCCTLMANKMSFFSLSPPKSPSQKERKKEDNILSAATMYEANLEMIS